MQAIDWLAKHSLYRPDKLALVEDGSGRRFTYAELNARANQYANALEADGVRPGDRVAMHATNCAEALFLFFGCTKLGAIFLPLNFRLTEEELRPIIAEAEPALLLTNETLPDFAAGASAIRSQPIPVDDSAPQIILYTSGTTGKPKGAILPHRMTLWNAINFSLRDLQSADTVLVHTPLFYTGGLNVYLLPAIFLGGTVVLMRAWNAADALRAIERERVTVFFAVPTQLLMIVESPLFDSADLSSLRYVISGGAPCPVPLMERLMQRGLSYKQGFGLTEAGPNCFALESRDAIRKAGSIGFPNFSVEARLVDSEGCEADRGELLLRTPAMISGYWRNPTATREAIRDGWFHTGDIAMRDTEGFYYIVDRKKDMYISGGENVYPAEVEAVLHQHPKVAEAAVIGIPDPKWGEVGRAVIVPRPGEAPTVEEIVEFCRAKLAKYKVPRSVVFAESLPRTHSGKVQKHELRDVQRSAG